MQTLIPLPAQDDATRDSLKGELLRMEHGHGGMKRGRFVYKVSGNSYQLDGMQSPEVDLWTVLDSLFSPLPA